MTTSDESALAGYFTMDPLLGSSDPFNFDNAWDADLKPEEYGDQSAWSDDDDDDDDGYSFTDSDDEEDDDDEGSCNQDGDWSLVYAASFTVVASASTGTDPLRNSLASKCHCLPSPPPPPCPCPQSLERKDSKVRFCEQPPIVVSYESCSRENYSQLYYSVHELQKIIDELRMEKKSTTTSSPHPPSHAANNSSRTPSRST